MKTNDPTDPDARLDQLLCEWRIQGSSPPRFGEQVWRRINRQASGAPETIVTYVWGWLNRMLTRPSLALSYVAVLLVTGLAAGYWHARMDSARLSEQLRTNYVQMMDPYQTRR